MMAYLNHYSLNKSHQASSGVGAVTVMALPSIGCLKVSLEACRASAPAIIYLLRTVFLIAYYRAADMGQFAP